MAIIALTSAKGSPGVTTTSLALTLASSRSVLLVEADPSGGDLMAGYVRGELAFDRGLADLAIAARHQDIAAEVPRHLIDLGRSEDPVRRLLLPGLAESAQAATVAAFWPDLAAHLTDVASRTGGDVIVDAGRLAVAHRPVPLLQAADLVLLVVRGTLRHAAAARSAVADLRRMMPSVIGDPVGLLVVEGGDYAPRDLSRRLGCPLRGTMPWQTRDAAALSDGIGRVTDRSILLRAARTVRDGLHASIGPASAAFYRRPEAPSKGSRRRPVEVGP